jgi:polysaccharide chain length determinant protein (PEP-CTERM system associated)
VLPGKTFTPEEVVWILWRRKWVIVVPLLVIAAGTFLWSRRLPKTYRSETVILVVPQRVPESYVRSTITTRIEDRLSSISSQILSRPHLEQIIQSFDLYAEQVRTLPMEQVVEMMRAAVDVNVERGDAFRIGYINASPVLAQKVTERLASLFIEENLREREVQAQGTNQFLDTQLEEARRRLLSHERRVEDFRRRYAGQLPSQVQTNLQGIQNAQLQLQALTESINRDRDRRLVLERQIADLASADLSTTPVISVAVPGGSPMSLTDQLEAAGARLKELELRYTPTHPDVAAARRLVLELEAKVRAESDRPAAGADLARSAAATSAEIIRKNRIRDLEVEVKNLDVQLTRKEDQERQLVETIGSYQAKVDAAPTRESELTELTRDYTTLQGTYTSLLGKREESKLAANLERNKVGEQFRVLDPARVPERPFSPDLARINLLGAALGLGLGLGLAALLEYLDSSFRTEDEVARILQLPVLALVPLMTSERELRTRQYRHLVAVLVAAVVLVGSLAAFAVWKLQSS